nr:uncharacterized protein LOC109190477 [Ipomoea batatas]GMC68192.1 uncharacterized protein LOC109190477 [Ipomoea batatas]
MDDPLRYFTIFGNGLQELVEDCEVWDLVNQCGSPKVIEIWIIKGGVGDDSNGEGCASNAENCEESDGSDDSGEDYDGSEEDLISDALDEILDVHWHQVVVQSEDIEGASQEGMASVEAVRGIQGPTRWKQVKPPNKSSRKKLPIKRYATRSGGFRSLFIRNDKDPINLD